MSDVKQAQERFSPARGGAESARPGFGPVNRVCQHCGASYEAKRRHQVFCSMKCRRASWAKSRTINPGYDIRVAIANIAADVAAIKEKIFGEEGRP